MHFSRLSRQIQEQSSFDPAVGAAQFGFRTIAGAVPSTREMVTLSCWAVVFPNAEAAWTTYTDMVYLFGQVRGDAVATTILAEIPAETIVNMSERYDSIGEATTLWITAVKEKPEARGAILAGVGENLLQVLALPVFAAEGYDRALYMLERIANNLALKEATQKHPPENDTMARLPLLADVDGILTDAKVMINQYRVPA